MRARAAVSCAAAKPGMKRSSAAAKKAAHLGRLHCAKMLARPHEVDMFLLFKYIIVCIYAMHMSVRFTVPSDLSTMAMVFPGLRPEKNCLPHIQFPWMQNLVPGFPSKWNKFAYVSPSDRICPRKARC